MRNFILLITLLFSFTSIAQIEGTWNGNIEIPNQKLPFVIHISKANNQLKVMGESPMQTDEKFPLEKITFQNDTLKISDSKLGMNYVGVLKNPKQIEGKFSQRGMSFPLNLEKGEFKLNRPQEPQPPFSYKTEDVTFENKEAKIKLAGTLTMPNGKGKFPAIVLVAGSGTNDRNEELFGHKPFMVIADHLTKNGYAVLRYDKRGVASSEGNFAKATVFDFASDAKAAIKYLKTVKEIDSKKIGVLGHSEGGSVAQIIASEDSSVNFIILMASLGIKGSDGLVLQNDAFAKAMGLPELTRALNKKLNEKTYEIIMRNDSKEKANKELKEYYKTTVHYKNATDEELDERIKGLYSEHIRQLLLFDPIDYLPKINCEVLAINGTKDLQVTSVENLAGIAKGLGSKGKLQIISYDGLNHLFQPATTGLDSEYGEIETTIEPKVLEDITKWLNEKVK
ncbi:hypothetical protein SAMN05421741_10854 [Paenimyroides ummariense]|uniref:Xaa-Pro dipeptidyl-peptidase-like domain-containing protein n=1 Tax=Paenimyroides ummariense TaxID=913024 RepID=A0A1I5AHT9_9FLAO|nr:alpha/beta fold hydrolase [Paenimyroides ummariense]SFN62044.1 hypothetical protein SAMN05421741_10854 [Paenimyroides ummariense]